MRCIHQRKDHGSMKDAYPLLRAALPSILSILGLVPMFLLLSYEWRGYLSWFILYYLAMDDLDGSVARALGTESRFGEHLDDTCDAVVHSVVAVLGGLVLGGMVLVASFVVATAIVIRMAARSSGIGRGVPWGEPGNEVSILWLILHSGGTVAWLGTDLVITLLLMIHAAMMLMPFPVRIVRTRLKRAASVASYYVLLASICLYPQVSGPVFMIYTALYLTLSLQAILRWMSRRSKLQGGT